jgi:hypothetical protein
MDISVPGDGEPREAVVVLKGFRATTGQEYLPGWTCGFAPAVVDELVRRGLVRRLAEATQPTSSEAAGTKKKRS